MATRGSVMTGARQPRRGKSTPASTPGSFTATQHAPTGGTDELTSSPAVPPRVAPGLVSPQTCRKCGGDGSYRDVRACAPCGGTGQVEGDRATIAARKARQALEQDFWDTYTTGNHKTIWAIQHLREHQPDRYEKALASHVAGRTDAIRTALEAMYDEDRLARDPVKRTLKAALDWEPPYEGLDTPEGAFDRCKFTSAVYTAELRARGIDADWVQVVGLKIPAPDAHPTNLEIAPKYWHHYVTRINIPRPDLGVDEATGQPRVDHQYVDWTMRQFVPTARYPFVQSQRVMSSLWAEEFVVDGTGFETDEHPPHGTPGVTLERYLDTTGHKPRGWTGP